MTAATPADDAAWAALLPGGTVWLSRPPRRAGPPRSPRRASPPPPRRGRSARGRGGRVRVYVAVPSRQHPLIVASWDRAVLRYLADSVLSVPPGTGPVLSAVLTVGLRLFRYPGSWLLAVGAPGRRRGAGRAGRMTIAPPRTLAAFIDQVGGRAACLAMSRDPNAKVTILLFPPGAARPAYVAKVPTTDAAARSVEREAEQLAEVGSRVLGPVSATIPKVVATVEHLGRPVLVMTALPGQSMLAAYHSWRHTARPRGGGRGLRRGRRLAGRTCMAPAPGTSRPAWRRCWTASRT